MNDRWLQYQDVLQQEHEAIEALKVIASAGFTKEADILASAAGLLSRWKQPKAPQYDLNYYFPY